MSQAPSLDALLGSGALASADTLGVFGQRNDVLSLDWPELDQVLPDRGLPRGVTELTAPHALGGATSIALAAIRAAQSRDRRAWCVWIDPEATLHAPGIVRAGVDLTRLLIVRPSRAELARAAVRVAASGAFEVTVIDADPIGKSKAPQLPRAEKLVRKLALLTEEKGGRVLLLTAHAPRRLPLPVALRLELVRRPVGIDVRVAKDRRGRNGLTQTVPTQKYFARSA